MLYQMVLGRRFEEKSAEVYRMGKIGGFCHLYIGQEAIGVGSMMALKTTDMVITAYRDHVQAMIKGIYARERFGRAIWQSRRMRRRQRRLDAYVLKGA